MNEVLATSSANGLDSGGMADARPVDELRPARRHRLSSHLIHEIEIIADELIVIGRGRIVAQGSKEMLTSAVVRRFGQSISLVW